MQRPASNQGEISSSDQLYPESYVPRFPVPGETLQGTKFSMGFGGKGANQCVMTAKLGAKSAMISKVGKDTFGDGHIKNFKDVGICTDYVYTTTEASTGAAPICVNESGQNSIVIIPGANLLLDEHDLVSAEKVISGSKVMLCQLEINPKITLEALKMGRKHGVQTILNPAPAIPLDKEFYSYTDVLCPNESEAELLLGIPVKTIDDAKLAARKLHDVGCRDVIVTLGEMGCVVMEGNTSNVVHLPAPKVEALDTTGAGDSFIGSLAYFLATRPELGLVESARRAIQIASVSVQHAGTQTSYPTKSQLPAELFS
ncbi:ribokinase-like isoform X1 [Ruditapes philippinarum]|uniref:ribokinase-like isoform X1 n=1 Tax=Ruditapes philippinarum TaxID=129788 RepID=UPI00295B2AA1|nr:ribokinase-like isoform X1 [Ruditapes philippinarum]